MLIHESCAHIHTERKRHAIALHTRTDNDRECEIICHRQHTYVLSYRQTSFYNPTGCVLYCADAASCCTRLYFTIDCTCDSGSAATYIHFYAIWTVVNMIFLLSLLLLLSCWNILHNFLPMWKEFSILFYILYRNFGMNGALISHHHKLLDFRIWDNPFNFFSLNLLHHALPFSNLKRTKYIENLLGLLHSNSIFDPFQYNIIILSHQMHETFSYHHRLFWTF